MLNEEKVQQALSDIWEVLKNHRHSITDTSVEVGGVMDVSPDTSYNFIINSKTIISKNGVVKNLEMLEHDIDFLLHPSEDEKTTIEYKVDTILKAQVFILRDLEEIKNENNKKWI